MWFLLELRELNLEANSENSEDKKDRLLRSNYSHSFKIYDLTQTSLVDMYVDSDKQL